MKQTILAFAVALTLATDLFAQTFTTLHSFTYSDGAYPYWSGLILSGNALYGTTGSGGSSGAGVVFDVNTNGSNFTNLYSFTGGNSGAKSSLILSGNTFYGTTSLGGSSGIGSVFEINTNGSNFNVLHNFDSSGNQPVDSLILSGNTLYGTTWYGGSSGYGTVFAVNTNSSGFTNLYSFTGGNDGGNPKGSLILSGNTLYGTTTIGGTALYFGTVFKVNTDGSGFTTLHSFTNGNDGASSGAGLILSGNTLYGITWGSASTLGTVFKINTNGLNFTVLHNFINSDGANPQANLILSGNTLYGTTTDGGSSGAGVVFQVNTDGSNFNDLHSFTDGNDGGYPRASLIFIGNTLFGTTQSGGNGGYGTVFALSLTPSAPVITAQPQSQTAQIGSNVTFIVTSAGSTPLNYQWFFNGNPIFSQTASTLLINNIQLSDGGDYSVAISNAYGATNSATAQLTVFAPLTLTPTNRVPTNEIANPFIPTNHLEVFSGGKFKSGVALNKNRMTIVMTHGFMDNPNSWATNMAAFILAHVSVPTPNIVAWDWSSEAGTNLTDLPSVSEKQPLGQGFALATNLLAALGTNYSQRVHFIGHSLGTLVNSVAANYLHGDAPNNSHQYFNPINTQMTLFDEGEAGPQLADALVALQNHQQDVRIFYDTPIPMRAAWIDNYISAFGLPHPEAANVILTKGAIFAAPDLNSFINDVISFHAYPYVWYDDSVTNSASGSALMGYRWSFEKNNLTAPPATNSLFIQTSFNPELTLQQTNFDYGINVLVGRSLVYVGDVSFLGLATVVNYIGGIVGQVTGEIDSTAGMIINLVTGGGASQNAFIRVAGGASPNNTTATNTPAYAWIPLAVPSNTVSMSFDFMLQGNGSNDNFDVALNGTNVLSLETSMIQTNVTLNSGLIDVSKYAGKNVELFLGIVGGTSTNASLTASDFYFYSAAHPSLQAQVLGKKLIASWPLSAAGFTLETSTNLTASSWTTVTNVPAIANLQNVVTNPVSGGARFYRLKQ